MRKKRKIGIVFDTKHVMQVPVKLGQGNHVHVSLSSVFNNSPHLILCEPAVGVHQIVAAKCDAGFGVEIVLVGFPSRQKIDLALDLRLRG